MILRPSAGDAQGGLTLIRLHHEVGAAADAGVGRKRNMVLMQEAIDQAMYIKVHFDYVTKILYIEVS